MLLNSPAGRKKHFIHELDPEKLCFLVRYAGKFFVSWLRWKLHHARDALFAYTRATWRTWCWYLHSRTSNSQLLISDRWNREGTFALWRTSALTARSTPPHASPAHTTTLKDRMSAFLAPRGSIALRKSIPTTLILVLLGEWLRSVQPPWYLLGFSCP